MKQSPDSGRSPSIRLTEDILKALGLTCILLDRGQVDEVRLTVHSISGRRSIGDRIWFRNQRDAEKVLKACLSRRFEAHRCRDAVMVKLPPDQVLELVRLVAFSLGITPIRDEDVQTTFESIHRRVETALVRMKQDGTMKLLHREYAVLTDAEVARKEANKAGNEQYLAIYGLLPKEDRERLKAEFKESRSPSWNRFLASKLPTTGALKTEASSPGTEGTSERDNRGTSGQSPPSYGEWLVSRLKIELDRCTDLVHITKL